MIVEARRRLGKALRLPDRDGWWGASLIAMGGVAIIATVAIATGLARFDPMPFGWTWLLQAALLVIVPSLGEEILFRGLIVPPRDRPMSMPAGIGAVAAFILWHPLQAVTIGPPWRAGCCVPTRTGGGPHGCAADASSRRSIVHRLSNRHVRRTICLGFAP